MWKMTSIQWVNDEHDGYVRLIYIERQPWWEETGYDVSVEMLNMLLYPINKHIVSEITVSCYGAETVRND